jgi:RNA polymerase sigma-70 factor, ECF subfamily
MTYIHVEQDEHDGALGASLAVAEKFSSTRTAPSKELIETVGKLRTFPRLLCMDVGLADHLVRVTLVRASVSVAENGLSSDSLAWLCARLRSYFYQEYHSRPKAWPATKALRPKAARHEDVIEALAGLAVEDREALVLTEGAGFPFFVAVRICRSTPGRFRDRVTRAKRSIAQALATRQPSIACVWREALPLG